MATEDPIDQLLRQREEISFGERYSLFPIKDKEMYQQQKKQEANLWTANRMDFSSDKKDYDRLTPEYKRIIDYVIAFFSATDGLIIDNIVLRFLLEARTLEEQAYFLEQAKIELVHAETYSLIINTLIVDTKTRNELFMAANNLECVKAKNNWLQKHMYSDTSSVKRRLVFACGEGIFFMSSFLFIFYFRTKGKLPNIIFANELIARDETLHRDTGVILYIKEGRLSDEEAQQVIQEAVKLELNFVDQVLPNKLNTLDPEQVKLFVKYIADHLLESCGHPKIWNISYEDIPTWINDLSLEQKSNFYEIFVGSYALSNLQESLDWEQRIKGKSDIINRAFSNPLSIDF